MQNLAATIIVATTQTVEIGCLTSRFRYQLELLYSSYTWKFCYWTKILKTHATFILHKNNYFDAINSYQCGKDHHNILDTIIKITTSVIKNFSIRASDEIGKNFTYSHKRYMYGAAPYTIMTVHMPWYGMSV